MMTLLRVLIVDDEEPARERARRLLAKVEGIEIAGEASSGAQALELIESLQPDLLLLDIQMPGLDGLRLLEALDDPPAVIFATAFEHHALRAFDLEAVDYLLKPYSAERLRRAIDRARRRVQPIASAAPDVTPRRIPAEIGTRTELLAPEDILLVRIADGVLFLWNLEGEEFLSPMNLAEVEELLPGGTFFRVSRQAIVNLACVRACEPTAEGGLLLRLPGGLTESASRRRARHLRPRLGLPG